MDSKAIDPGVAGLGLFGSVAKREATEGSDIDVLEFRTDVCSRSVQKIQSHSGLIDVQVWPLYEFARLLSGESSSACYDAFKFDILRTIEILHDPRNILNTMKSFAIANSLPHSSERELLEGSKASLRVAKTLFEKNLLVEAQIVLRGASDDFAKSVLLGSDIASINPSEAYLGGIKSIDEDLYGLVLNVYGLDGTDSSSATSLVKNIDAWMSKLTMKTRLAALPSRNALWLSFLASEVADASRNLGRGEFSAAVVQARHAAVFLDQYQGRLQASDLVKGRVPDRSFRQRAEKNAECELLGLSDDVQQLEKALNELSCLIDSHSRGVLVPRVKNR